MSSVKARMASMSGDDKKLMAEILKKRGLNPDMVMSPSSQTKGYRSKGRPK